MRNIYKMLVSILILVMAAMLMSAKEPPNVEQNSLVISTDISKITELTKLTIEQIKGMNKIITARNNNQLANQSINGWSTGNMYLQVCCLERYYSHPQWDTRYQDIPLSIEVWDGKLNPWANVRVEAVVRHYNRTKSNWEIYSYWIAKQTNSQGKVRFGYQINTTNEAYGDYFIWITASYSNTQWVQYVREFTLVNTDLI